MWLSARLSPSRECCWKYFLWEHHFLYQLIEIFPSSSPYTTHNHVCVASDGLVVDKDDTNIISRHLIRRAAFRAAASPSTSFISKPRSITTSSPFLLRSKVQNGVSSSVFRRFASEDANASEEKKIESADGEEGSVRSAIDSVTETASTYASDAAESLTSNAQQAKDSFVDGAAAVANATGIAPRQNYERQSRPAYQDRNSDRSFGARPPVERNLTPTSSIYVGNLLFDITANDLSREFEQYGEVKSSTIATDARGLSKG